MSELYIGVMSGTSLDGIDVALCEIDEHSCKLLSSQSYPLSFEFKEKILLAINSKMILQEFAKLDHALGLAFADALRSFLKEQQMTSSDIVAIGLHGQTLWHDPKDASNSLQIGDANVVAARSGIDVVSDFRRKDIAFGGQGAPFAPAFHAFLFHENINESAIVNIGGMSNITVMDEGKLIGYDVGCGNVLLDMWMQMHQGKAYDEGGIWAKSGMVIEELLKVMLHDVYFQKSYPKSTGREYFSKVWLDGFLRGKTYRPQDIQRTLLELTALSIAREVQKFSKKRLILCGGGAKNSFLVERIQANLPTVDIEIAKESDMLEAMAFSWFACMRVHRKSVALSSVTGAKKDTILGAVYAGD